MNKLTIILAILFFAVYTGVMFMKRKNNQASAEKFLEANPDAVKIFVVNKMLGVKNERINIFSINGAAPIPASSNSYLCKPGNDITIEAQYSSDRMGIIYKTVSSSTNVVKLVVDVKKGFDYELTYDKKEEQFNFKIKE